MQFEFDPVNQAPVVVLDSFGELTVARDVMLRESDKGLATAVLGRVERAMASQCLRGSMQPGDNLLSGNEARTLYSGLPHVADIYQAGGSGFEGLAKGMRQQLEEQAGDTLKPIVPAASLTYDVKTHAAQLNLGSLSEVIATWRMADTKFGSDHEVTQAAKSVMEAIFDGDDLEEVAVFKDVQVFDIIDAWGDCRNTLGTDNEALDAKEAQRLLKLIGGVDPMAEFEVEFQTIERSGLIEIVDVEPQPAYL